MKITRKTTMEQLNQFLGENAKLVQKASKELFDQMDYASKMMKKDASKVTRQDLVDLAKSVAETLGDKCIMTAFAEEKPVEEAKVAPKKSTKAKAEKKPVEDSLKTAKGVAKSNSKKDKKAEEPAEEELTEVVSEKAEKTAKKSGKSLKKDKKDGVTTLEDRASIKIVPMAKQFPETITVGDAVYEIAHDIKEMKDLHEALENDEEIVFAYWWTKRHLKQFPYFSGMLGQPKSFKDDLDLATAIYVSDEDVVAYAVSMYTEAIYTTIPMDLPEEDGLRINCGMEYQIYRAKAQSHSLNTDRGTHKWVLLLSAQ